MESGNGAPGAAGACEAEEGGEEKVAERCEAEVDFAAWHKKKNGGKTKVAGAARGKKENPCEAQIDDEAEVDIEAQVDVEAHHEAHEGKAHA